LKEALNINSTSCLNDLAKIIL
jgi:hypothetical protein